MRRTILLVGGTAALGYLARRRGLAGLRLRGERDDPTIAREPSPSMPWMPQRTAPPEADPSPPRPSDQASRPGPDDRSS